MTITKGTFVQTRNHGHRGIVYETHRGCPEGAAWCAGQSVPIRPEALAPDYPWHSILVDGGGAVVVADYDIEVVEPFQVTNRYLSDHFPDGLPTTNPQPAERVTVSFEVGENIRQYTTYQFEVAPEDAARIEAAEAAIEPGGKGQDALIALLRELYTATPSHLSSESTETGDLADDPQESLLEVKVADETVWNA